MIQDSYLNWLAAETPARWWHDSGDPDELAFGLAHGAVGATTNPVLVATTLGKSPATWASRIGELSGGTAPQERTETLMRAVVANAASVFGDAFEQTGGLHGYACAQVNPAFAGDRQKMWDMAQRFHAWGENIAIKLPATAAGLDVMELCVAGGMTVVMTVSFTVPQVLAIAERHKKASALAKKPGRCFAVIMAGRLDDYLTDVAKDRRADVSESDLQSAGVAVAKRAYGLFRENGYEAVLMVAALRGTYHVTELTGAEMVFSIHPKYQGKLLQPGVARIPDAIRKPVDPDVIARLMSLPDFVKAYEPNGMAENEFISYGLAQRTLSQFQASWSQIETAKV